MASLQLRSGSWRVIFRHKGMQHFVTVGEVEQTEAQGVKAGYEYLLRLIKQRLLNLPPGMDIVTFLRRDGKPSDSTPVSDAPELTLAQASSPGGCYFCLLSCLVRLEDRPALVTPSSPDRDKGQRADLAAAN